MQIDRTLSVHQHQYVHSKTEKAAIFLHHLAGTTGGSVAWWNNTKDRVATHFIISRDGTIHQLFPLDNWAFHLGVRGDDNWYERHSIGIELESYGGLVYHNKAFCAKLGSTYHKLPNTEITVLPKEWRGYRAFHKYTEEQCKSVQELLEWLWLDSDFENLLPQPKLGKWWEYDDVLIHQKKSGIYSHTTVRPDKSDIYPDTELLKVVKAAHTKARKVLKNAPSKTGK